MFYPCEACESGQHRCNINYGNIKLPLCSGCKANKNAIDKLEDRVVTLRNALQQTFEKGSSIMEREFQVKIREILDD